MAHGSRYDCLHPVPGVSGVIESMQHDIVKFLCITELPHEFLNTYVKTDAITHRYSEVTDVILSDQIVLLCKVCLSDKQHEGVFHCTIVCALDSKS